MGIGSDYDGIESTPKGLEDVSKYPNLVSFHLRVESEANKQFAELITRGWDSRDLARLAGGNLLRVMRGMEDTSRRLRKERGPNMAVYDKRTDLGLGRF